MATSAKVKFNENDNSGFIPSSPGIKAAMVHPAKKGKAWKPLLLSGETKFNKVRGTPDLSQGIAHHVAYAFYTQSDALYSIRATHLNPNRESGVYTGEAKFATSLIRGEVLPVDLNDGEAVFSQESVIVQPYKGMVQEEIDSFIFDQYHTNREYEVQDAEIKRGLKTYVDGQPVVKGLVVSSLDSITENSYLSFSPVGSFPDNNSNIYQVINAEEVEVTYHALTLTQPYVSLTGGSIEDAVIYRSVEGALVPYTGTPTVKINTLDGSLQVIVSDSDMLGDGDVIAFGTSMDLYTIASKALVTVPENRITFDSEVNYNLTDNVYVMTQSDLEDRDCLLFYSESEGDFGNTVSCGIEASKEYSYAFDFIIYVNGTEVERYTNCTRSDRIDGLNNQMNIEDKVNGKSEWGQVKSNINYSSDKNPLVTSHAYFRPLPVDVFVSNTEDEVSGSPMWSTIEKVLNGDVYVRISEQEGLSIGDRIRFGTYLEEYKILAISTIDGHLTMEIDRGFIPSTLSIGTSIRKYVRSETQKIQKIDNPLPGYKKDFSYTIGGTQGILLDAGSNFSSGGSNGDPINVYDLIRGTDALKNKEEIKFSLLLDGGFAIPAYAQALTQIAQKRGDCFVYLSTPLSAEESSDYLGAIKAYRSSLNINSSYASLFTGWVKVSDPYNQKQIWVSPVGYAAAAQSYTATNEDMWIPAAGWARGKLMALDVKRRFDETERDELVESQINPIRYKDGSGLVIWGNETLLVEPSVLQMRHVRFLEIVIRVGLEVYLEGKLFDLSTEQGRLSVESETKAYMRDEIGDGVLDSLVSVVEYTTGNDLANRRVRMFLGIKPAPDVNIFEVDLSLFNANQEIRVI